jgi:hypothetical protein
MAQRVIVWDKETAKRELGKRLANAMQARAQLEKEWDECERTLFNTKGSSNTSPLSTSLADGESEAPGESAIDVGINYAFKNFRFIHSQLSANPPTVVARPTSNDPQDRRKADAADRLIRFSIRQYSLQELFDICSANCLQYGTGFLKTIWDPDLGEILDFNEKTGEMVMEGDHSFSTPSPRSMYLDPDATRWPEVKWVFEEIIMPYEEACFRFASDGSPSSKDILRLLEKARVTEDSLAGSSSSQMAQRRYDVVKVYQYWEAGQPYNGMIGRFCYCVAEGDPLTEVKPNPFRFRAPKNRGLDAPSTPTGAGEAKELPGKASLPYHIFTDIDVPGTPWGRAVVTYEAALQDLHNRMLNVMVDNLQAHGVARLILPEGSEVADDSITNSPYDIVKVTGSQPPHFMEPMPLPASLGELLGLVRQGVDDMAGVNEAMFGQQSREQSGFSMQYATNQGNMIRRRLFNKYVLCVESVYKAFLNLVRKYWNEERTIYVLGKEKAFEAVDIKGADIDGGFDLVVEYGASLSLDPTTRREEIITLLPLFEKAGVETRTVLSMLKLNELEGLYDRIQMAADRQREIFEEMLATGEYQEPRKMADHKNMLAFAYDFIMTSEFKYLAPEQQAMVEKHIQARELIAAQGAQPPGQQAAGGGQPSGPLPAVPGAGGPMDVTQMAPMAAG